MSLHKHASIASLAVAGSRVAGLLREVMFAMFFGAGPVFDAFIAAFRIPNLLRDLFSEGALSSAFVSVFSRTVEKKGDAKAWELGNRVNSFILILIGVISILGILFSPWIVGAIASGFTGEKYLLTVKLNRILFPFILFVSLASVCMGMLNTKGRFALPQSASTFFNLTSIFVGLGFAYLFSPDQIRAVVQYLLGEHPKPFLHWEPMAQAMTGMALGTLLGGCVQWWVQIPSLHRLGYRFRFFGDLRHPDLWEVLRLTGPAIIGGAAVQVNVLVNTNFASYLADGSISWLAYAFRLMQFPIGVFGVAVAIASTPELARLLARGDRNGFRETLGQARQMALFLCIPSALGLIVFSEPIIALIYQYGQFSLYDTRETAYALMAYAAGLSFYALVKIDQPAFLSMGDAKTPMLISLASMLVNLIVNWVLVFVFHFSHWGLALGTSFVALFNALLLNLILGKRVPGIWKGRGMTSLKIGIASVLAVGITKCSYNWVITLFELHRLVAMIFILGLTLFLYYHLTRLFRIPEAALFQRWTKMFKGMG